jgi:hypothetical protein
MITAANVRAQVVDIRDPAQAVPVDLVADANVLYWIFYPNFSAEVCVCDECGERYMGLSPTSLSAKAVPEITIAPDTVTWDGTVLSRQSRPEPMGAASQKIPNSQNGVATQSPAVPLCEALGQPGSCSANSDQMLHFVLATT